MKEKKNKKETEVFIRSDGWMFTKDGMDRLKAGGYKGFNRFKENMEKELGGEWHRVSKPLDQRAADILKTIKGMNTDKTSSLMIPRAKFLSSAILAEAKREAKGVKSQMRTEDDAKVAGLFMRLTLTDEAFKAVKGLPNPEFRRFVSEAIYRAAK